MRIHRLVERLYGYSSPQLHAAAAELSLSVASTQGAQEWNMQDLARRSRGAIESGGT